MLVLLAVLANPWRNSMDEPNEDATRQDKLQEAASKISRIFIARFPQLSMVEIMELVDNLDNNKQL